MQVIVAASPRNCSSICIENSVTTLLSLDDVPGNGQQVRGDYSIPFWLSGVDGSDIPAGLIDLFVEIYVRVDLGGTSTPRAALVGTVSARIDADLLFIDIDSGG